MKRLALYLILILLLLAGLAWAIAQSPGYVLITYDRFRYESTLWVFLGLIFVLWLLALLLNRLLGALAVSAGWVNPWSRRHRRRRADKASRLGQRELAEGQWSQALGHLRLAAEQDALPLPHYLGAARAANELGEHEQCDALLERARAQAPDAQLAIGLTRARLLVDRGDYTAARDTLQQLHLEAPRNTQVLQLLQKIHVQLHEWVALCALLPELRKLKVLPPPRLDELERLAWSASLEQLGAVGETERGAALEALQQRWKAVPGNLRGEPALVRAYASGLCRLGDPARAAEVLQAAIGRHFDEALVELYGRVPGADPARQLAQAEGWLKAHPEQATLLLALGRLSVRNQLWGKARDYLEASLRCESRAETCAELARLLARLGDTERSNRLFLEGVGLLGHGGTGH